LEQVQCSEQELITGLQSFGAFELNCKWRILDNDYLMRLSDTIISTIFSKGMNVREIKCSEVINSINGGNSNAAVEEEVIKHVLHLYSKPFAVKGIERFSTSASSPAPVVAKPVQVNMNDIQNTMELDMVKISVFRAKQLLSQPSVDREEPYKRWKMEEFMDTWKEQMYGLSGDNGTSCEKIVTLELCKNLSLVEHVGTDKFIRRFYASDLPTDVKDRFKLLFQVRNKWTEEDLKPFVDGIVCTGKSISSLLIKNTRSSMVKVTDPTTGKLKNVRMYSSR